MRNRELNYGIAGTSALQPEPVESRFRVIDGSRPAHGGTVSRESEGRGPSIISKAVSWNRRVNTSTCVAPVIDDRQQLVGELGFFLVVAIVVLGLAFL